ncbi:MAG: hypothetical protein K2Y29_18205 [Beijerinckiaceae bacterium]|nr:hypothetical protein [Beijerinckiaceae bacterium]
MKYPKLLAAFAGTALLASAGSVSYAADLPRSSPPPAPAPVPLMTQWEFAVSGYVWASGVKGTLGTIPPLPPVDVNVPFSDILKNLGGALMGTFEAKYGRFILFNDFIFTALHPNGARSRDALRLNVSVDSVEVIGLAAAGYRVIDGSNFSLDLFAGVRGFYMDNELTVRVSAPGFSKGASYGASKSWVDAVGGIRVRYDFDDKWMVNAIAFAGGGASKYEWDVYAGAAYKFTSNWAGFLGYRAFKVDYRDGDFIYDVLQHGPVVGVQYRW